MNQIQTAAVASLVPSPKEYSAKSVADIPKEAKANLKILLIHCQYLQKAGEDAVVEQECQLLSKYYELHQFIRSNEELQKLGVLRQLSKMLWNKGICDELQQELRSSKPDIIHVHNTFPLFSPAIFRVLGSWKKQQCKLGLQVKIVLTLHNFRLHCPQASLMRPLWKKGKVVGTTLCQRCFTRKNFWSAIRARCYRHSFLMTSAIAVMLSLHKCLRSWRSVDTFIYLNQSQKTLLSRVKFPEDKFILKPNFLFTKESKSQLQFLELAFCCRLLFIGRLSEEKGVRILLHALRSLQSELGLSRKIELNIAGDGPLRSEVEELVANSEGHSKHGEGVDFSMPNPCVRYLGRLGKAALQKQLRETHFVILPSIWYEGMPMSLLESLLQGRPVIGFRLGASAEILHNQENGILADFFQDAGAEKELKISKIYEYKYLVRNLAGAIKEACLMNQKRYNQMCLAARRSFEEHYTEEQNIRAFRDIYGA